MKQTVPIDEVNPINPQMRRVRVSPDNRYVVVSSNKGKHAAIYTADGHQRIASFPTKKGPMGFGFAPDGEHAYLCCHDDAVVFEFELKTAGHADISDRGRLRIHRRVSLKVVVRIFLAGAGGVIGRRLTPLLLSAGHTVTGTTRSARKPKNLRPGRCNRGRRRFRRRRLARRRRPRPAGSRHSSIDRSAGRARSGAACRGG